MSALTRGSSALMLSGALAACGDSPPPAPALFPLNEGLAWDYRVEVSTPQGIERSTRSVSNVGNASIGDEVYKVRRWSDGVDFYIGSDDSGVFRRGLRTFVETEPRRDSAARFVLKAPYAIGSNWTSDTHPYLLWRTDRNGYDYKHIHTVQMSYTIISTSEQVTVPAGVFTACLLVEGEAALSLYTDPVSGVTDVPIITREWYAPGVGLVKAERLEQVDTNAVKGGRWQMELLNYR